jgi:hypothetical protein
VHWSTAGFVPTGWYPTAVAVQPGTGRLLTVAAKGLGSRYPAGGAYPVPPQGSWFLLPTSYYYVGNNMPGLLTSFDATKADLGATTEQVRSGLRFASEAGTRPDHSPIPPLGGGPSPITHVVYIVRENRTFDQIFGDLGRTRSDVDADPNYELLAAATPNAHSIASRYAISDRFFSDGEVSVQGHWWTSSADSNDYIEKSWRFNYSPRNRPGDDISVAAEPRGCSVFQAAAAKQTATGGAFTVRDYGEFTGLLSGGTFGGPQADRSECPTPSGILDANYNPALHADDRGRAAEFLSDVGLDSSGNQVGDASHFLRNFSYLILPQDHTTGFGGTFTPRAEVAQNDAGLGMILSSLSRSKYWSSTAVFVVEDDSQDGLDHVDGHRNVLLVASPWTRHATDNGTPGYVSHRHSDQAAVLHTMELILGLPQMSSYDQLASPLYDMFQPIDDPNSLTLDDLQPFDLAPPPSFIEEHQSSLHGALADDLRRRSATLDTRGIDRAGPELEAILWQSIRPGPLPKELRDRRASAGQGDD